jgi:nucleoside-diphosphate kinase
MKKGNVEQTLALIKPDALKYSQTGYVYSYLAQPHTGLIYAGKKIVHVTEELAKEHYKEHEGKPYFEGLIDFITGKLHYPDEENLRRVEAIVFHGQDAISRIRQALGPTNPNKAKEEMPGSLRSLGSVVEVCDKEGNKSYDRFDNLVHGSSDRNAAESEIKLWFKPEEIPLGMRFYETIKNESQIFYDKESRLFDSYEDGRRCIFAPGDLAWKSDLIKLKEIRSGERDHEEIGSIVLKYLMNR